MQKGMMRKASIKETGEELSEADWARFDAAVADAKAERAEAERACREPDVFQGERADAIGHHRSTLV